eukprot:c7810_g1_i3.p1 GENE.c7810_g1_i3~~c7810_g1_i3.p1  ORF type:complete len:170 (+),score=35.87 c7810_g1_i3:39-512(+)
MAEVVPQLEEYTTPLRWLAFACDWSERTDQPFRLAVGSFMNQDTNQVSIFQLNPQANKLAQTTTFSHSYPATKLKWFPSFHTSNPDLLLSSGDCLRAWEISQEGSAQLRSSLIVPNSSQFRGPLTSFDWNPLEPEIVCTSSTDSTCAIWNLQTSQIV